LPSKHAVHSRDAGCSVAAISVPHGLEQHPDQRPLRVAAPDRIVDDDQPLCRGSPL
jgi:hypothetical protein